jgi:serine/threonine protein kinase
VLNALRENKPPTYSPAEDVYAFGMVCYELRTGHIPFEGHRLTDYELALSGRRPELPNYLSPRMTQPLRKCWHKDPALLHGWSKFRPILEGESGRKLSGIFGK